MMIVEGLSIIVILLHLVKSFGFLLFLRVFSGILGGIALGVIPPLLHDEFSPERASLGGILCYIILMLFMCLGALMDKFYGGYAGLLEHYRFVLAWPAIFGIIRLIMMKIFLRKLEAPGFWIENEKLDEDEVKSRLTEQFIVLYRPSDVSELIEEKIEERRVDIAHHTLGSGLS